MCVMVKYINKVDLKIKNLVKPAKKSLLDLWVLLSAIMLSIMVKSVGVEGMMFVEKGTVLIGVIDEKGVLDENEISVNLTDCNDNTNNDKCVYDSINNKIIIIT